MYFRKGATWADDSLRTRGWISSGPADLDGLRSLSNFVIPLVVMTMFPIPGVVFCRNGMELLDLRVTSYSGTGR